MNNLFSLWGFAYLRWDIVFVFLPSLVIWILFWRYLIFYKKTILFITILAFCWGFSLDLVGVNVLKIWHYNPPYLGVFLFGLPLEEYILLASMSQMITSIILLFKKFYG